MDLLKIGTNRQSDHEVAGSPLFTMPVKQHLPKLFTQYGFIAGISKVLDSNPPLTLPSSPSNDPRLFFNIATPSSAFICGSQGSGKSHTLSSLLENCLMKSEVSQIEHPLAGLIFHYDSFTSDERGTPCEAAHLSSNKRIKVRVLCSPANIKTIEASFIRGL